MKTIKIFYGFWNSDDVRQNSEWLFVFGDNDAQRGKKGQAIVRGEFNAIGVPTKKFPNYDSKSYYKDEELKENERKISYAFNKIKESNFDIICFPENQLGTGLADLQNRAPKTFDFLQNCIRDLMYKPMLICQENIDNVLKKDKKTLSNLFLSIEGDRKNAENACAKKFPNHITIYSDKNQVDEEFIIKNFNSLCAVLDEFYIGFYYKNKLIAF